MTRKELIQNNYKFGKNNYILLGNQKWVAFQKSIVDQLIQKYGEAFNIIIYWDRQSHDEDQDVNYVCVPYAHIKTLLTPQHLSTKKAGNLCWNFIIKNGSLMVHANSSYSLRIDPYINAPLYDSSHQITNYSVEEGERLLVEHKRIERNPQIVDIVKTQRQKIDPNLHCDVCGFSFVEHYGKLGKNFIEAHHKMPLSEYEKSHTTNASDFALVCSNCHRMLHRQNPAITIMQLKELLCN